MKLFDQVVLVRHAESESNRPEAGQVMPEEFWRRRIETFPLTADGVRQARACGSLLRAGGFANADRYLVSPMARALETAALLDVPGARWHSVAWLSERAWGPSLRESDAAGREAFMADASRESTADPWYWNPPAGENLAAVAARAWAGLHSTAVLHAARTICLVAHGELIRALRCLFEPGLRVDDARARLGNAEFIAYRWSHDRDCSVLLSRDTAGSLRVDADGTAGSLRVVADGWRPVRSDGLDNEELLDLAYRMSKG